MRLLALSVAAMFVALLAGATTLQENFSGNPLVSGWKIFGNTNLFHWNSTNENLEVTWDSAQSNSYFYHPLGTILTTNDDFTLEFDLRLDDAQIQGFGFELALGLLNLSDATNANFIRGTGRNAPNLVEFDYFPDFGFGPSIDGTLADNTATNFHFFYANVPLDFGTVYHVVLSHAAGTAELSGQIFTGGNFYTDLPSVYSTPNFFDFRVNTLSISSYSGSGSGGSILAHGVVDNFVVTLPPQPIQNFVGNFTNGFWTVNFLSQSNWLYTLERAMDFQSWTNASLSTLGNGTNLFLIDASLPTERAFYRVRAERP
jgi:hypothetical protein